ncbi:MAG: CBS domain-containing protein, partial [Candidatus Bathyarchaeia archaeon]
SDLKAKEVMSSPLVTIKPEETLSNAARQMSRLNMRRFGVVYKGELVGVVSSKDVLAITPELLDTIQEKVRIESGETAPEENSPMAGHCDRCSQWSNRLREIEGEFQCEDCRSQERDKY